MPFNVTLKDASAVTGQAALLIALQSDYVSIEDQLADVKARVSALQTSIAANPDFVDNVNVAAALGGVVTKITNAEADLL